MVTVDVKVDGEETEVVEEVDFEDEVVVEDC